MIKKDVIAMILAGGQGTRLGALTNDLAKPAVPFGGKYRIIDFTLSNCVNSGISTIGVLTQYCPLELNNHINSGESWGVNKIDSGVTILPPYQMCNNKGDWYKGTADAIYQNINYIDRYNPEYVVVLSGDHVYKMDYSKMLEFHKKNEAEITIAVTKVDIEDASRFGIMNTREDDSIYEFEEKPAEPKSNKASMGIYIFNWMVLKRYLQEDSIDIKSSKDFGKDIIPKMLKDKRKMYAYTFEGYWKDVGTVESLWESNMDLLNEGNSLNLYDLEWPIYTNRTIRPAQYIGKDAKISNSLLVDGSIVHGEVKNSVIFSGVYIGNGVKVIDSIVMPNTIIEENSIINKVIISEDVVIRENCKIGNGNSIIVISKNEDIENNTMIE